MRKVILRTCCVPRTFLNAGEAEDPFYPVNSGGRMKSTSARNYGKTINSSREGQLWLYKGGHQSGRLASYRFPGHFS